MHHVAIICSSYDHIQSFYVHLLGLEVVRETFRAERNSWKVDVRLPDGVLLELFTFPDAPGRPSRPEAQGLRHLSLATDHLDAAVAYLVVNGVAVEEIRVDETTGRRFTFFADPDMLPIELYELA
jgi:glyoxylase I family protein